MKNLLFIWGLTVSISAFANVDRDVSKLDLSKAKQHLGEFSFSTTEMVSPGTGNDVATIFGFRGVGFATETCYIGGEGGFGWITGGPLSGALTNGIFYGGLVLGYQRMFEDSSWGYNISLLAGIGGNDGWGNVNNSQGQDGLLLRPTVGLVTGLWKGARLGADLGYFGVVNTYGVSGVTFGLHIDFRRFSLSWAD
jgi:hypothetical protein